VSLISLKLIEVDQQRLASPAAVACALSAESRIDAGRSRWPRFEHAGQRIA
jgi:hypothetical protein